MAVCSSAVSGRLSIPAVISRSVWCPTCKMTFTEVAGKSATYFA